MSLRPLPIQPWEEHFHSLTLRRAHHYQKQSHQYTFCQKTIYLDSIFIQQEATLLQKPLVMQAYLLSRKSIQFPLSIQDHKY